MISIPEYANLPENRSGFWTLKLPYGSYAYVVLHQGMAEFSNSISEAKQILRDRYAHIQANKRTMRVTPIRNTRSTAKFILIEGRA